MVGSIDDNDKMNEEVLSMVIGTKEHAFWLELKERAEKLLIDAGKEITLQNALIEMYSMKIAEEEKK